MMLHLGKFQLLYSKPNTVDARHMKLRTKKKFELWALVVLLLSLHSSKVSDTLGA